MSTNVFGNVTAQQSPLSDEQLLSEARSGDGRAFGELCQKYTGLLKQRIVRIVRHQEDAEDVLQETFLSAYQHLDGFRGTCSFCTWMTTIGINASLMLLRKRKTFLKHTSDVVTNDGQRFETPEFRDPRPNPEQRYMMYQTDQRVKHAIRRLPPRLGRIVDLYYRQECRLREAAIALGISESAAKSAALRARNLLRRSLYRKSKALPE